MLIDMVNQLSRRERNRIKAETKWGYDNIRGHDRLIDPSKATWQELVDWWDAAGRDIRLILETLDGKRDQKRALVALFLDDTTVEDAIEIAELQVLHR